MTSYIFELQYLATISVASSSFLNSPIKEDSENVKATLVSQYSALSYPYKYMEGEYFDDIRLEFFPAGTQDEKRYMPVVTTSDQLSSTTGSDLNQGIYQDEESVDFSALLEAYNSESPSVSVSSGSPTSATRPEPIVSSTSGFTQSFRSYLTEENLPLPHHTMFGSDSFSGNPMRHTGAGPLEMTPSPPSSIAVDCIGVPPTPSPHVVQIEGASSGAPSGGNFAPQLRPAPGKAPRVGGGKGKKNAVDKSSFEYRQKRDRNNIAVRKSREKSKIRVLDTEKRVKELEEENTHLQSKIALLTKELNVLKSLFTSAGVSQPPSFPHHHYVKDEVGGAGMGGQK